MEFKRLSDVEAVAEPTESANVLIEEDGVIKKAPKTAVGGGSMEWDMIIKCSFLEGQQEPILIKGSYQDLYNKVMVEGEVPKVKVIFSHENYGNYYTVAQAEVVYEDFNKVFHIGFRPDFRSYDRQYSYCTLFLYSDNSISD